MTNQQRPRRLGKGLDTLIGPGATAASTGSGTRPDAQEVVAPGRGGRRVEKVGLDRIDPNPWQPRRSFSEEELEDLIRSVQRHGLLQPITVRRAGDRFQIIAGERRWRASQELGTGTIDAMVVEATDEEMLEWSVVENAQRQDLTPIETASAFRRLMDEFGFTQEDVAERVGQSRPHVANTIRLLDLPQEIQDMVSRGTISPGAGRALLSVRSAQEQLALAKEVAAGNLTVRQIEARGTKPASAVARGVRRPDPNLNEVADEMQSALALRVRITGTPRRGAVTIAYHAPDELARIHRIIMAAAKEGESATEAEGVALTV